MNDNDERVARALGAPSPFLMPVERCSGPTDELRCFGSSTTLSAFDSDNFKLASDDLRVSGWSAEPGAPRAGCIDSRLDSLGDELAFVLGERAEHADHKAAGRSGWINAVDGRPQGQVLVGEDVDGVEDIAERAAEPIDSPYDDDVARLSVGEQNLHLRTLHGRPGACDDVGENVTPFHTALLESGDL